MKAPDTIKFDFETKGIQSRPEYPPVPVGVSIQWPGDRKPHYYSWGHPTGNNCSLKEGKNQVQKVWRSNLPILCQHAKFDVDVAQTHMDCGHIPWERIHDTLYLLFLNDPHAISLSLKPSAQKILGMEPEEQDAVHDWLLANGVISKANQKGWGAFICKAPGTVVGPYANGDNVRSDRLFKHLWPLIVKQGMQQAYDRERRLMPIFLNNERQGLRVDVAALRRDIPLYTKAREAADRWLRKRLHVADDFNLDSDAALAEALDSNGIVTEWAITKTGKRSTSKKTMTVDKFTDNKVFLVLGYRNKMGTCLGTFMEPWLEKAERTGGVINPNWNQVRQMKSDGDDSKGTRTGRPSCDDPNLLNVSKSFEDRGDGYTHPKFLKLLELPLTRRYILPDEGTVWLHRDYNQQELRLLGHFEDGAIQAAYNENPDLDIHQFVKEMIEQMSGNPIDRVSTKTLNFGRIYGQGLGAMAEKLRMSVADVKSIRDMQNSALPGLPDLDKAIKELSAAGQPIMTWGGRLYYVEEPKYVEKFRRVMSFDYKLLNYLIQGSAADVTKEAVIRHDDAKKDSRFLVTVYDEINICAPPKAAKKEMKILKDVMESVKLDVPMISDGKMGPSWGELKKYEEKR